MARLFACLLLAAGCSGARGQTPLDQLSNALPDGNPTTSAVCDPPEYDAGSDGELPPWAAGFFHADPPTGGADPINLRLGPGLQFAQAIAGCGVFGNEYGRVRVDDAGVWLLPDDGGATIDWLANPSSLGLPVTDILLKPGSDGGVVAICEAGVTSWSPGLRCCAPSETCTAHFRR